MLDRRFFRALPLCVVLLAGGCSRSQPRTQTSPETLYRVAMREVRAGNFGRAQTRLQTLTFELTSRDTLLPAARFFLAETYFGLRDHVVAAREFRRVADDFPGDAYAPQALLRAGDAYAAMWRRPALDPSNGETALAAYRELMGRYPDAPAARIAAVRVQALLEQFAEKDFQTALFYYRRGAYESAILYLRGLIQAYPTTRLVPDAFVRLVQAYRAIGYREEEQETCAHLRQYFGTRADVRDLCGDRNPGR
jgi:outer membrane protein assembly factor BamD